MESFSYSKKQGPMYKNEIKSGAHGSFVGVNNEMFSPIFFAVLAPIKTIVLRKKSKNRKQIDQRRIIQGSSFIVVSSMLLC